MSSVATRFFRYMPTLGGMIQSPGAEPLYIPGFGQGTDDDCLLFTSPVIDGTGRRMYQAFEGRAGNHIAKPELTRGTAGGAARAIWQKAGRAELDRRVNKALKDREVQGG